MTKLSFVLLLSAVTRNSGFLSPSSRNSDFGRTCRLRCAVAVEDLVDVDLTGDGGVTRRLLKEGEGKTIVTGDIAVVNFTGKLAASGLIFSKGEKYRSTLEDGTMISGWDIGLGGLKVGDEAAIKCSSRYAYGSEGVPPVIPPDSDVEFNIEVLKYEGNIMNPSTFADANPLTPRTPESIKAAFEKRMKAQMAMREEKEKLEGFDKLKRWLDDIYIFGFFESLDGASAPWYLRPLITFPIMFTFCGVAFYLVLFLNGLSINRQIDVQDEVDVAYHFARMIEIASV